MANWLNSWKTSQSLSAFENQDLDLNYFLFSGSVHRPKHFLQEICMQPWTQVLKDAVETQVHTIQQNTGLQMHLWICG